MRAKLLQLYGTFCDPMDYSPRLLCPWESAARILQWVAVASSRGSPPPRWHSGKRICLPMQETRIQSLGQEDPLEKEMATHSGFLAFEKSHGWRRLVGYSRWGHKESNMI